jgi:hypothetical protein
VRQHYLDSLNRDHDAGGLAFWTNEITSCGPDPQCIEIKRINVSAAFFLSIEFQETGYFVYRMCKAAYGDMPGMPVPLTRQEFLTDTQYFSQGVVVDTYGWEHALENNMNTFVSDFVARTRFTTAFPGGMSAEQFVDRTRSPESLDCARSQTAPTANGPDLATNIRKKSTNEDKPLNSNVKLGAGLSVLVLAGILLMYAATSAVVAIGTIPHSELFDGPATVTVRQHLI